MKNFSEVKLFIKLLDGWLSQHEGYFLYSVVKNLKGKGEIVEIGSWMGKSTICLAAGSKKSKIYAIDPHKGEYSKGKGLGKSAPTYKVFIDNLKKAEVRENVVPVVATSEGAVKRWKKSIKFIFIDGLHDYKHTREDYDLWNPFVKKNGIIALHDAFCGHIGPEKVVLESILPSKNFKEIGVVGSIIYAKKGKPNFFESVDLLRIKFFISLARVLNKRIFPFKFFIIHRVIKLLLLNKYTFKLLVKIK